MKTTTSRFYCTCCGNIGLVIYRRPGQRRKRGHLKKMYCLNCKREVNMVEVREDDPYYTEADFRYEYEHNNFTEEGTRKMSYEALRVQEGD